MTQMLSIIGFSEDRAEKPRRWILSEDCCWRSHCQALEFARYFVEWPESPRDIERYTDVFASEYNDDVAGHKPNAFSTSEDIEGVFVW